MSVISFSDNEARDWVVERIETERRSAETRVLARAAVAQQIGIAPGTVENIDRGRFKGLRALIRDKIHEHKIRCIRREFAKIAHELAIADRGGSTASPDDLDQARAALKEAQEILQGGKRG